MSDNQKNKADMRKTLTWVGVAYGAFTALSVIAPLVLDKLWKRREK